MTGIMKIYKGHTLFPLVFNIELTDACPLNCPYCYKDINTAKNLDFHYLIKLLDEFSSNGGKYVLLSGGEPLMYSHLIEAIKFGKSVGLKIALSTSGYGLNEMKLRKMSKYNLDFLYISLNSHIEAINKLSRDGYNYAIKAMQLCQKLNFPYWLNTVVRHDNLPYLEGLIDYAKKQNALGIDLLSNKPDRYGNISSPLDNKDIKELIKIFRKNGAYMNYQTCFTIMKTYFNKQNNHKNLNQLLKGCSAGLYSMTVFSNGSFSPCPHCESFLQERFKSITEYWEKSQVLAKFRQKKSVSLKCEDCTYSQYCSPCTAFSENEYCLGDLLNDY